MGDVAIACVCERLARGMHRCCIRCVQRKPHNANNTMHTLINRVNFHKRAFITFCESSIDPQYFQLKIQKHLLFFAVFEIYLYATNPHLPIVWQPQPV